MQFQSLKNHFLIATPALQGGIFEHSITYLCEHDEQGAMGLVINRPLDLAMQEVLEQLDIDSQSPLNHATVLAGGPVHTDRGFVLHDRSIGDGWESCLKISDSIALTTSMDVLRHIAQQTSSAKLLVALGYAGWSAGQLEQELENNAWLSVPADDHIIFDTPAEKRVDVALAKLGVSFSQISPAAGHS